MAGVKGRSGAKPKPTALKVLHGTARPDRVKTHELMPTPGIPTMPGWLLPEAKSEWRRVVRDIGHTGVITMVDRSLLAVYCQLWARFVEGERSGDQIPTSRLTRMQSLAAEFGIGPAIRARMDMAREAEAEDPMDAWERNRRA